MHPRCETLTDTLSALPGKLSPAKGLLLLLLPAAVDETLPERLDQCIQMTLDHHRGHHQSLRQARGQIQSDPSAGQEIPTEALRAQVKLHAHHRMVVVGSGAKSPAWPPMLSCRALWT